jgi:hypothetical protein
MVRFNVTRAKTFERLFGISALLDVVDNAIPRMEWLERQALDQLATEEQFDSSEYDAERQVLNEKFRCWAPRFGGYSIIIIVYSILETELLAFAEQTGRVLGSNLRVEEIPGKGIERSASYLKRVAGLDIKADAFWSQFCDLREIRNSIVHRSGKPRSSRVATRWAKKYEGKIWSGNGAENEVCVSMTFCRDLIQAIKGFFERCFKAVNLPLKVL